MPTVLKQTEGPATYDDPNLITDANDANYDPQAIGLFYRALRPRLSSDALALDQAIVWTRMESFVSWRWHSRAVEWIVDGDGEFDPPLEPATITKVELWRGGAWGELTLVPSPLGGVELDGGRHRITATVGTSRLSDLHPGVVEAFRRILEYLTQVPSTSVTNDEGAALISDAVGVSQVSISRSVGDDNSSVSIQQNPRYRAKAIEYSGAGDLLRKYRKGR